MSNHQLSITVIMPAFNEATRIGHVLTKITPLNWIDQIIVVDDASTDETVKIVRKNFPKVKILTLSSNQGKSEAIKQALELVNTSWVLMLDADIWGFDAAEITYAWKKLQTNQQLSQLILALTTDPPIWNKFKLNVIMSGQRFIPTQLLKNFFLERSVKNYDLEILFTDWGLNQNLSIGWLPFTVYNYKKLQKWPWWQAIPKSLSFYGKWLYPSFMTVLIKQILQISNQIDRL